MITRIHVNQHIIKANRLNDEDEPPLSVKQRGRTKRARRVSILGPSCLVYQPNAPLSCGARVWIETEAPVEVVA